MLQLIERGRTHPKQYHYPANFTKKDAKNISHFDSSRCGNVLRLTQILKQKYQTQQHTEPPFLAYF